MTQFAGKYVVLGLGQTGLSCVRFLKRLGCDVVVVDTRSAPPGKNDLKAAFPDVQLLSGSLDKFDFSDAQELVVSPGISIRSPAIVKAQSVGVSVAGDVELFARSSSAPVIAVTGSNGKSTVATLLGKAMEASGFSVCVAGNIGLPVLDALTDAKDVDVWVLELSSFQLETTHSLQAKVAINLNVSEDHMDRYDSLDDYATAKQRIFDGCEAAVYWIDDRRTQPIQGASSLVPFGGGENNRGRFYVDVSRKPEAVMSGQKVVLTADQLHLKGVHNLLNIAAVLAALDAYGVDYSLSLSVIKQYPGLPHRCQWVANVNGVDWYNDSKGTNIGSTIAAIQGLSGQAAGRLIWIAGGDGKGADFSALSSIVDQHVDLAIVYGRDAEKIQSALADKITINRWETLQQSVADAYVQAQPGDLVLLSPACASLDQFKNYEERGFQFMNAVKGL